MTVSQNWRFRPFAPASVEMNIFDRVRNSWTRASRTATSRVGRARRERAAFLFEPAGVRLVRALVIVRAAKQRDILVAETRSPAAAVADTPAW